MSELFDWIYDDITWCGNECANLKCERNLLNRITHEGMYSQAMFKGTEMCPLTKEKQPEINKKDIIDGLEYCLMNGNCTNCTFSKGRMLATCRHLAEDAVKLLKQQPEIVRCKDCRHHKKDTCSAVAGMAFPPPDDFFCADGERK